MSDLIKREEAIGILNETQVVYFAPNGKEKVQEALDMAIEALSADAVQVVRCKDCKYFVEDVFAIVNGVRIIAAHEMCNFWGNGCKTKGNGYCSYGERK